jgi:hypothetical protein
MTGAGLPHSETPGSTLGCQLPGAYRRLPRPSSAPDAKASTVCPKKLEHKSYKMLAFTMQFSKHERTPTHNHHQHPPHRHKKKTLTAERHDAVWRPDRPARPRHPANPARQTRSGLKKTHPPPNPTQQVCGVVRFLRTQQCDRSRRLPEMVFLNPPRTAGSTHIRDNPADDRIASAPLMS